MGRPVTLHTPARKEKRPATARPPKIISILVVEDIKNTSLWQIDHILYHVV